MMIILLCTFSHSAANALFMQFFKKGPQALPKVEGLGDSFKWIITPSVH